MKFALISDIHANLEALEAVLARIPDLPVLCLGDTVGYGVQPNEVINRIRGRASHVIMGNHDLACADGTGIDEFNPVSACAAQWTNHQLSQASIDWLLGLPYVVSTPTFALVHGSPQDPERFRYVLNWSQARFALDCPDAHKLVTFVGHSHCPTVFKLTLPNDEITITHVKDDQTMQLRTDSRYIVNVGSVGQPRDRDPRACYAVYDDESLSVSWHRVPYDITATQARIFASTMAPGAAQAIADRLALGQ
jgi:diadenosine tetraphosphatase ApaH/serine/threonine PP2A family protein phosphatase